MIMQSEQYSAFIAIACMIGTGLSLYSYYVETKLAEDSSYEAMCDISEQISCSKVFTSEWVCRLRINMHKINLLRCRFGFSIFIVK